MKVYLALARAATALRMTSTAQPPADSLIAVSTSLRDLLPLFDREKCQRRRFLLRHGETDWNARGLMQGGGFDIELNESGRHQAEMAAQELASVGAGIGVVASSHLQRAKQTADLLHARLQEQTGTALPPLVTMPEFGEMRFGDLEGNAIWGPQSTKETRNKFAENNAKMQLCLDFAYPGGGESTRQVQARGVQGLQRLYEQFPQAEAIAIVAHGRFNKVLLASLLYGDALRYPQVKQGNTCINVVDCSKNGSYKEVLTCYMDHMKRE